MFKNGTDASINTMGCAQDRLRKCGFRFPGLTNPKPQEEEAKTIRS